MRPHAPPTSRPAAFTPAGERSNADVCHQAVAYAIQAPSSHNSQPWFFHMHPTCDAIELYADRTRALPIVDPDDRELVMSCGAALLHLRLALRGLGFAGEVELLPDESDRDLLARVRFGAPYTPTAEEVSLLEAMPRRRTTRRRFEDRVPPDQLLSELQAAARAEGAELLLLRQAEERERLADLVADGDRVQARDPAFRRELAAWMRSNQSRSHDGMPGFAHAFGTIESYLTPLVIRTFDWGKGQAAMDRELAAGSPVMAVLSTDGDDAAAWLRAGQALARVLLRACADGVTASYLNQPVEVPSLREALRSAFGIAAYPQLVLRFGYGPEAQATPRRPVEEVLV